MDETSPSSFYPSAQESVVAEAGCNWYHFDINIFPLSKKKESVAVSMQLVKRDKYVFMWKCIVFKTIMIIKICFPD
jgi:hypothetical protein